MASIMSGAVSTLLSKLGELLTDEYKLQKSVRDEIMILKKEFERMQAVLLMISEAPMDQPPSPLVMLWARDVRELSYAIEDRVDTFMVGIDRAPKELHGLRGFIDRCVDLLTKAKIRHKLGTEIKDLKKSIKGVTELRDRYNLDQQQVVVKPEELSVDNLRLSAMYKKATELIGIEEKSNELIVRLMEGDEPLNKLPKRISIVGFGGLGKTTLAKVVYDKLKGQFECAAFVSVSLNPNIEKIFINILDQLGHDKYKLTWSTEQLINGLIAFLQEKRYFIVIDDIWKTSVWKIIQCALLVENKGGSIIISTTRNRNVANEIGDVYQLQPLSLAESRKLFNLRIFGTEDKCLPNELAKVSTDILRKCGGVPLAIIMIASTLASQETENTLQYWSMLCQTLGSGLEGGTDVEDMRRILSISYFDLPPYLKSCMLYLSSYPEDYLISTKELIQKWIGEGFILEKQGKSFYEVGEDYIDELINRSLIQPSDMNHGSNKADYCRVHDMVLDLVTLLANKCGFLTTIDDQQPRNQQEMMHRLSLHTSNEEKVKQLSTVNLCRVRSLILGVCPGSFDLLPTGKSRAPAQASSQWQLPWPRPGTESVLTLGPPLLPTHSTFPVLRVLCLRGCRRVDSGCFKEICNLFHLRYLGLRNAGITEIPKEIKKLQLLQALDVRGTGVYELPSTFGLLTKLVLVCADTQNRVPAGFGNIKSLQELDVPSIRVESPDTLNNFTGLAGLRHVRFVFNEWDESYKEPFLQCLSSLVSLKFLQIIGSNCDFSSPCYSLTMRGPQQLQKIDMTYITVQAVPEWMSALRALTILHISLLTLGEEGLHVLGRMPSLSHLHISLQKELVININKAYPFLSLRKFEISNIKRVVFLQGAMPKLQTLLFRFRRMETIDQFAGFSIGLENLSSLLDVYVCFDCPNARPEEVKAAKATILYAVDMNKNKPSLHIMSKGGGGAPMAELVGRQMYSCCNCRNNVCLEDDIISKRFMASSGGAYLFSHAMNTAIFMGPKEDKMHITGLHSVADIHCRDCHEVLGWKYEKAYEESERHKEGKFVFEKSKIVKENR